MWKMAEHRPAEKPWDRKNPRKTTGKKSTTLTGAEKAEARARARTAGRPYPNLVDNMAVARKKKRAPKTGKKR